jgi:hypothetical protein
MREFLDYPKYHRRVAKAVILGDSWWKRLLQKVSYLHVKSPGGPGVGRRTDSRSELPTSTLKFPFPSLDGCFGIGIGIVS